MAYLDVIYWFWYGAVLLTDGLTDGCRSKVNGRLSVTGQWCRQPTSFGPHGVAATAAATFLGRNASTAGNSFWVKNYLKLSIGRDLGALKGLRGKKNDNYK